MSKNTLPVPSSDNRHIVAIVASLLAFALGVFMIVLRRRGV